jgi:hypothetical protein
MKWLEAGQAVESLQDKCADSFLGNEVVLERGVTLSKERLRKALRTYLRMHFLAIRKKDNPLKPLIFLTSGGALSYYMELCVFKLRTKRHLVPVSVS